MPPPLPLPMSSLSPTFCDELIRLFPDIDQTQTSPPSQGDVGSPSYHNPNPATETRVAAAGHAANVGDDGEQKPEALPRPIQTNGQDGVPSPHGFGDNSDQATPQALGGVAAAASASNHVQPTGQFMDQTGTNNHNLQPPAAAPATNIQPHYPTMVDQSFNQQAEIPAPQQESQVHPLSTMASIQRSRRYVQGSRVRGFMEPYNFGTQRHPKMVPPGRPSAQLQPTRSQDQQQWVTDDEWKKENRSYLGGHAFTAAAGETPYGHPNRGQHAVTPSAGPMQSSQPLFHVEGAGTSWNMQMAGQNPILPGGAYATSGRLHVVTTAGIDTNFNSLLQQLMSYGIDESNFVDRVHQIARRLGYACKSDLTKDDAVPGHIGRHGWKEFPGQETYQDSRYQVQTYIKENKLSKRQKLILAERLRIHFESEPIPNGNGRRRILREGILNNSFFRAPSAETLLAKIMANRGKEERKCRVILPSSFFSSLDENAATSSSMVSLSSGSVDQTTTASRTRTSTTSSTVASLRRSMSPPAAKRQKTQRKGQETSFAAAAAAAKSNREQEVHHGSSPTIYNCRSCQERLLKATKEKKRPSVLLRLLKKLITVNERKAKDDKELAKLGIDVVCSNVDWNEYHQFHLDYTMQVQQIFPFLDDTRDDAIQYNDMSKLQKKTYDRIVDTLQEVIDELLILRSGGGGNKQDKNEQRSLPVNVNAPSDTSGGGSGGGTGGVPDAASGGTDIGGGGQSGGGATDGGATSNERSYACLKSDQMDGIDSDLTDSSTNISDDSGDSDDDDDDDSNDHHSRNRIAQPIKSRHKRDDMEVSEKGLTHQEKEQLQKVVTNWIEFADLYETNYPSTSRRFVMKFKTHLTEMIANANNTQSSYKNLINMIKLAWSNVCNEHLRSVVAMNGSSCETSTNAASSCISVIIDADPLNVTGRYVICDVKSGIETEQVQPEVKLNTNSEMEVEEGCPVDDCTTASTKKPQNPVKSGIEPEPENVQPEVKPNGNSEMEIEDGSLVDDPKIETALNEASTKKPQNQENAIDGSCAKARTSETAHDPSIIEVGSVLCDMKSHSGTSEAFKEEGPVDRSKNEQPHTASAPEDVNAGTSSAGGIDALFGKEQRHSADTATPASVFGSCHHSPKIDGKCSTEPVLDPSTVKGGSIVRSVMKNASINKITSHHEQGNEGSRPTARFLLDINEVRLFWAGDRGNVFYSEATMLWKKEIRGRLKAEYGRNKPNDEILRADIKKEFDKFNKEMPIFFRGQNEKEYCGLDEIWKDINANHTKSPPKKRSSNLLMVDDPDPPSVAAKCNKSADDSNTSLLSTNQPPILLNKVAKPPNKVNVSDPHSVQDLLSDLQDTDISSYVMIELSDNCVLCERGGLAHHHVGNIKFRELIAKHSDEYREATPLAKRKLVKNIIDTIHGRNGQFVHRLTEDGARKRRNRRSLRKRTEHEANQALAINCKMDINTYIVADPKTVYFKVCQALREDYREDTRSKKLLEYRHSFW